ncbi:MAG: hypothetical protein U1E28_12745 [Beijerinckiaceae bacterium]
MLRRTEDGWRAEIAQCALPGGYEYALRFDFIWNPARDPSTDQPSIQITLRRNVDVRLKHDRLIDFLNADDNNPDEIVGILSKSQVAALTQTLFGNSFDITKASSVMLAFRRESYWVLRAGNKLAHGQTESLTAKQNRFRALSDEGISLQFREVFFTTFTGTAGSDLSHIFTLNPKAKRQDWQDVRALFAGDGAPPAPDDTLSAPRSGRADAAIAKSEAMDERATAISAEEKRRLAPRVLYALVRHDAIQAKANPPDAWNGTLTLGRHAGGERASLTIHDVTPRDGASDDKTASFLGWRNQGDGNPIFALRAPWMVLSVKREATASPTEFPDLSGSLWCGRGEDNALRIIASLTPTRRRMFVETRFGRFTVAPLPPIAPRSGVSARVPPILVGGTGARNARTLNHLAAPVALEQAAIPLVSERLAERQRRRADTGEDTAGSAAERAGQLFSQLTFHEAECLFHIEKLPRRHVWTGTSSPSTDPPQGEALVHIGATKEPAELSLPARLSLNAASLLVRRPADLLALNFRFQDLVLEYGEAGWWVVPDRRLAASLLRAEPKPDPTVPLICNDKAPLANDPTRYDPRQDPRPLLVVEFPPQHIAERAYFRQLQADPALPVPPKGTEVTEAQAESLRTGDEETRRKRREDISKNQTAGLPDGNEEHDAFIRFYSRFGSAIDDANTFKNGTKAHIPKDQRIYVGPAYLDLEAARVARKLARDLAAEQIAQDTNLDSADKRARMLSALPEVQLLPLVIEDLRKAVDPGTLSEGYPEPIDSYPSETGKVEKYLKNREALREARDPDYKRFREFYGSSASDRKNSPGLTDKQKSAIDNYPTLPGPFYGRRSTIARVEVIAKSSPANAIKAARAIIATIAAYDLQAAVDEPFEIPTEARVSGPSRLVFRIPADDFEGGRPDARDRASAGAFPFTIEALTNWGALDLAVVRRAEKVFEPLAGVKNLSTRSGGKRSNIKLSASDDDQEIANGRLPPRWARQETRDEAAKLLHQGLTRGDAWAVRHDEQRALESVVNCPTPLARLGSVTGAQRMAEIAASVRPPSLFETSIELPFRLMLSPAQDAAWRTPLGLPAAAKLISGKDGTYAQAAPVPLWFAQLEEAPGSSSVRAIWSPDFRPEALLDPAIGAPPHGPWAPWAMAREVTSRNPYNSNEALFAPPGQTPGPPKPPERFRTGLDVGDRHELVGLSSLHGLPVRGRRRKDGTLADGSQISPPPGFKLRYAQTESLDTGQPLDDYSAIYRPRTLGVDELTLTALGGSFDADTNFVPPASANVVPTGNWLPDKPGNPLFDAFSIERWQQNTRLGRDIRVEVAYKGFLFPLGHRASLVKLTERHFMQGPGGLEAGPVAFQIQRLFLRIGAPIKKYPALSQPNGGRRWPVEQLEILTRVTPDILDPMAASPSDDKPLYDERPNGRIFLREHGGDQQVLPGLAFWPRVRARNGGEVNFELQIDSRGARTRLPLIFVDNTAANDVRAMKALKDYYNALQDKTQADPRRVLQLGGNKYRYAPEKEPDGTSFETEKWVLEAEGQEQKPPEIGQLRRIKFDNTKFDFGPLLQGVDQPPFYPVKNEAFVRIAQVDRLVGRPTDTIRVFFDAEYQAFGFPQDTVLDHPTGGALDPVAKTDVYLDFRTPVELDPRTSGDRTGGAVRPNTTLVAMSRSRGPVGNSAYHNALKALAPVDFPASTGLDNPKPETFFGDATILGILDLKAAIKFLGGGLSSAPQFNEVAQYTSAMLTDLSDEAASDAGAAVAKVRDRLLIPMREALLTLARQFFEAVKQNAAAEFDEDEALLRIERLYPDVGKSYRELRGALEQAISSSESTRSVEALLGAFATIYGAGRRFLAAIERVANDPLAPVHEALREAFNRFIGDVIARGAALLEGVTDDLKNLQRFEIVLRSKLNSLFSDVLFRAWRHIVFALPGAHAIATLSAPLQVRVDAKVEEVLSKAAADADFFGVLLSKDDPATAAAEAAKVLGTAFDQALIRAINDASSDVEFQGALNAAYNDWKLAVGSIADADAERIKGMFYDVAAQQLRALLVAARGLAGHAEPSIRNVIGDLEHTADAALDLIRPLVDEGLANAIALCGKLAGILKSFSDSVNLPSPSVVDQARADMKKAFDDAGKAVKKVGLDEKEVQDIFKALDDGVGTLTNVRDALRRALDQLLQVQSNVCSAAPDRLPLDAFAALGRMRSTVLDAAHSFTAGLSSPHFRATDLRAVLAKITGNSPDSVAARKAVIDATKAGAKVVVAFCLLVRDATALRDTGANGPLKKVRDDLAAVGNAKLDAIVAIIDSAKTDANARRSELDSIITDLTTKITQTVVPGGELVYLDQLLALVDKVPPLIDKIQSTIVQGLERAVLNGLAVFLVAGEPYLKKMVSIAFQGMGPVFKFLSDAQATLVDARNSVWLALGGTSRDSAGGTPIGGELSNLTFEKVRALLLVKCSARPGLTCSAGDPHVPDEDFLTAEKTELARLNAVFASNDPTKLDNATLNAVLMLFHDWSINRGSLQILAKQLADAAAAVLSGDLKRIVDLEGARRRIEEKIKELVPAKIVLNYDLQAELQDFPPSGTPIFLPRSDSQITLSAGAVYNLLEPTVPPQFRASCRLDPFDINLFNVVTLMFDGAQFINESGKGSDFNIVYKDFELGPNAAFLKPLQTLMNPGGSGPYVRPSREVPGIEAGYSLDLGIISIGTVSFVNVSINAACVLPFNNARATFVASIGREDRPVLLSIAPYTGGGFLALYADSQKLLGFAASFEFGGGGAFKYGPLSGQGRICTGIYLRKVGDDCLIEGFFYAGGEAHVACFAISATLVVRIGHRSGGSMQGSAIFTFSFSVGFAKLRYQVGVQKSMGQGFSGARATSAMRTAEVAFAPERGPAAVVRCRAKGQQEDWLAYQTYFASDIVGFPS